MGADVWTALLLAALLPLLLVLSWHLVWRPRAIARSFARQGIRGAHYRFLAGSLPEAKRLVAAGRRGVAPLDAGNHDIVPVVLPQFHSWAVKHGRTFLYWMRPIPAICSTDLELIKEVLTDKTGLFLKDYMSPALKVLLGNGMVLLNGDEWKQHRKVVLPAFNHEKLKSMLVVTAQLTEQMIQAWRNQMQESNGQLAAEINMSNAAFGDLTEEIIGHVGFGSNQSDREASKVIVAAMHEMQKISTAATADLTIFWYLPSRHRLRMRRLDNLLRTKITAMMQARVAAKDAKCGSGYGDDLFGMLMEAWSPEEKGSGHGNTLTSQEVIDEWKTFFAAGQETTATLLSWSMFLLSVHPEWQEKVRQEVLREWGRHGDSEVPSIGVLTSKLKLLHMVILETSRLYPSFVYIQQRAARDVVIRGISVPRGTVVSVPIVMLHRDKEVWGSDADEFNPARFENGIAKDAKDPKALLSFSLGPRACIGQSFGVMEAQMVMALILRNFSFSLSPKYVHKPKFLISLTPKLGMSLIVRNQDG